MTTESTQRAPGDPRFKALLDEEWELHQEKGAGYGTEQDTFANLRGGEWLGMPAWKMCLTRASDKWARIQNHVRKGDIPGDSLHNDLRDMAMYLNYAEILYEEEQRSQQDQQYGSSAIAALKAEAQRSVFGYGVLVEDPVNSGFKGNHAITIKATTGIEEAALMGTPRDILDETIPWPGGSDGAYHDMQYEARRIAKIIERLMGEGTSPTAIAVEIVNSRPQLYQWDEKRMAAALQDVLGVGIESMIRKRHRNQWDFFGKLAKAIRATYNNEEKAL
jgi:hypothetical protein